MGSDGFSNDYTAKKLVAGKDDRLLYVRSFWRGRIAIHSEDEFIEDGLGVFLAETKHCALRMVKPESEKCSLDGYRER